jgi:diguanylate cyclase (GGDEF)-like protein
MCPFASCSDLDNLKHVNDAHGHAEANCVIRRVAGLLAAHAPAGTEVARVGGDEFALLVGGALEEAQALCNELKRLIARDGLDISFGWAARPDDGESSLDLFRKADDRLYAAKLLGRNRRAVTTLAAAANQ